MSRLHQLLHEIHHGEDLFVVVGQLLFHLEDPARKLLVFRNDPAQFYKGPYDENAHLDGTGGIEHTGCHDGTMLREYIWEGLGILQAFEVAAACDQQFLFFRRELKHEIMGEAFFVSLDLFVQAFRGHPVQLCQVRVYDYFFASYEQYALLDYADPDHLICWGHCASLLQEISYEVVAFCDHLHRYYVSC